MKINKSVNANQINSNFEDKNKLQKDKLVQAKTAQASSMDALDSQGRALVMSFKGRMSRQDVLSREIKELTDDEFKDLKAKTKRKSQKFKFILPKNKDFSSFNKYNIQLADKILSSADFFEDRFIMNELLVEASKTNDFQEAQAKNNHLLNPLIKGDFSLKNDDYEEKIKNAISNIYNPELAEAKIKLTNTLIKTGLTKDIKDDFLRIIIGADTENKADTETELIEKLDKEELLKSYGARKDVGDLLCGIKDENEAKIKLGLLDKLTETGLIKNESVRWNIINILNRVKTPAAINLIDKLHKSSQLNRKEDSRYIGSLFLEMDTPEKTECKNDLINKLEEVGLLENDNMKQNLWSIIYHTVTKKDSQMKIDFIDKLNQTGLLKNKGVLNEIGEILRRSSYIEHVKAETKLIDKLDETDLLKNEGIQNQIAYILKNTGIHDVDAKIHLIDTLNNANLLKDKKVACGISDAIARVKSAEEVEIIIDMLNKSQLPINQVMFLHSDSEENSVTIEEFERLNEILGIDKASRLSRNDLYIAAKFANLYHKQDIDEIPIANKRTFLRNLVAVNSKLFESSDVIKEYFPILPTTQEEYCKLLPSVVQSLGIKTNTLSDNDIENFNRNIKNLSSSLEKLSDNEFNRIRIGQEYDKDHFIKDVLNVVKELPSNERQKVFDYFGFELSQNDRTKTGFQISGYPISVDNNEKLNNIEQEETKNAIKNLKPYVIKFSENNPIKCNNKKIEEGLNELIKYLPELRTTIGKIQAGNNDNGVNLSKQGSHEFDILQHSLKVMQKIVQNKEYQKLNDSDKKIMLIASLLHDITKKEGYTDNTHANEGSFDTCFIAKKFKLSQEEEIKLYNLVKHHEWLGYVNSSKNAEELDKRLKNTAYDLRHDNMLDMSLIFTHADLKAVKSDDSFHDKTYGRGRTDFNGVTRSFGESADYYAGKIQELIEELKPTQPFLPITKIPTSSRIKKAITQVNPDGSTNIKGVYQDKNGLIVLKYNELENEDLEKIGFPKGSLTKGVKSDINIDNKVNTGNIKFFVHGLDWESQLINFSAFSLIDSDALLSVSYAERPESKYRFFRPQGVVLDCDTKYIHGGGETDAGSGHQKNVQKFKDEYIFGGKREENRAYVANLIKKATGMSDSEYIEFVKKYENKPLSEVEPEDIRTKIINAFATINSHERYGEREYNEMYISNPKPPMAVYAYNIDSIGKIGNPIDFINREKEDYYGENIAVGRNLSYPSTKERTGFLQKYALKHDIPFIVFGNQDDYYNKT